VTVITPSRNQARYIDDCLRSVHCQTHRDVEHIVVDGMSSDHTKDIVAKYPSTFLQRKDSGPAQAINRGLDIATGDVVCWLNADDAFFSHHVLARIVELFSEFPRLEMITGNGYFIDEDGKNLNPIVNRRPDRCCLKWIRKHDFILQPATFWRRNPCRLDETLKYCFDWKLWLDFFESRMNILYVPEYFALYRVQLESLTFQNTADRMREIHAFIARNGRNRAQSLWAWWNWRIYQISERLDLPVLKELSRRTSIVLGTITDGLI
jgi:glycosyltransferase involved in cell wall biosynthesis